MTFHILFDFYQKGREFKPVYTRIIMKFGSLALFLGDQAYSYNLTELNSGRMLKRYINQLHSTCVPLHSSKNPNLCYPKDFCILETTKSKFLYFKSTEELPVHYALEEASQPILLCRSGRNRQLSSYLRGYQLCIVSVVPVQWVGGTVISFKLLSIKYIFQNLVLQYRYHQCHE